jgi:hypothetical protein
MWRADDFRNLESEDAAAFLPEPITSRRCHMIFPVSCSGLCVCQDADSFLKLYYILSSFILSLIYV